MPRPSRKAQMYEKVNAHTNTYYVVQHGKPRQRISKDTYIKGGGILTDEFIGSIINKIKTPLNKYNHRNHAYETFDWYAQLKQEDSTIDAKIEAFATALADETNWWTSDNIVVQVPWEGLEGVDMTKTIEKSKKQSIATAMWNAWKSSLPDHMKDIYSNLNVDRILFSIQLLLNSEKPISINDAPSELIPEYHLDCDYGDVPETKDRPCPSKELILVWTECGDVQEKCGTRYIPDVPMARLKQMPSYTELKSCIRSKLDIDTVFEIHVEKALRDATIDQKSPLYVKPKHIANVPCYMFHSSSDQAFTHRSHIVTSVHFEE